MLLLFPHITPHQTELRVLKFGFQLVISPQLCYILLIDFLEQSQEVVLGFI